MLSNGRGAQVSHGKLFGQECRDGFLASSILWPTLCPLLSVLRVLFQHRHWSLPVCVWQACWRGVTVLPVSAVQTWTWVFLSIWKTSRVDLTALNLTHGYFYCLILEGIPCAGSRGRQMLGKVPCMGLQLRASWFGCGLGRRHTASRQWEPAHDLKALSCPATTWYKKCLCSFHFLLQIASFNRNISCVQDGKGQ